MLKKKEGLLIGFFTLITAAIVFGQLIPSLIGLVAGGFDTQSVLNQFSIYQDFLLGGIIALIAAFLLELIIRKDDSTYGDGILFGQPGQKPSFEFWKKWTNFQLFLLSFIASLAFFTLSIGFGRQEAFTNVPFLEQQFTETGSLLFTTFLVPMAENISFAGTLALLVIGIRALARRYNWSFIEFRTITFITVTILGGILEVAYHLLRYGSDEVAIAGVFIFWALIGLLTAITGSFMPGWAIHITNNLVFDLQRFFSNESVVVFMLGIAIFLLFVYSIIFRGRWFGGEKRRIK